MEDTQCKICSIRYVPGTLAFNFSSLMFKKFITSILSGEKGSLSSKRLCGFIGWLVCVSVLLMCTVWDRQAPEMTATIIYASTALLGLDSVTDIWKNSKNV